MQTCARGSTIDLKDTLTVVVHAVIATTTIISDAARSYEVRVTISINAARLMYE